MGMRIFSQKKYNTDGFTLIELMLALLIIAILAILAQVSYSSIMDKLKTNQAISDLYLIDLQIERFKTENFALPADLSSLDIPSEDPWGNAYEYLNFDTIKGKGQGQKRSDHNLVPLNTDYDLYSKGPDGDSVRPLTAKASRDDIVRANNGGFIGVAADY